MEIASVTTGLFEEICYFVWSDQKKAIVFDPGYSADLISKAIKEHELEVVAHVCTHAHTDHINALAELHAEYPAPIFMHSADLKWAFEEQNQLAPYPVPKRPDIEIIQPLESQTDWHFSDLHFQCIETPGHTPGGCCILFPKDGILVSGDTLFRGSCGRTDLLGGNPRQLHESLQKLKQLPEETRVYPGHGPSTTIGIERASNYFMQ